MDVYLAGPYGARERIRGAAYDVVSKVEDAFVVSSWLDETHEITDGTQGAATALSDEQVAKHAMTDLNEIGLAQVVVLFTAAYAGTEGGGGRHVETGYALALEKPVIVVGEPENVFHRIGSETVRCVGSWAEGLEQLRSLAAGVRW